MKVKWLITFGLVTTLLLGACGGEDDSAQTEDQAIATPVATIAPADTGATAEDATAEATATEATATEATATEATATEALTDTGTAETDATETVTVTGEMTGTEGLTDTGEMTDTEGLTETEGLTGTGEMTGTEGLTGTESMTDTAGVTGAAAMTGTDTVTGTGAMTSAGAAVAPAATVTGTAETTGTTELQTAEQIETYGVVRASELMDFDVENAAREDLGDVDDAIVTLPDGCIQYVLVSSGGFLGLGEDQFLVPWRAVALNLEDSRLVLNVDQAVFDTAPIFDSENVPDLNMPDWDADISGFWEGVNVTPPPSAAPEGEVPAEAATDMTDTIDAGAVDAGVVVTDTTGLPPGNMDAVVQEPEDEILVQANPCDMSMTGATGTMTDTVAAGATDVTTDTTEGEGTIEVQTPQAVRLSALMDFDVRNSDGEDLGELEDIVIDWQQSRLGYPIISFGGFLGLGDKWFVIPFDQVTLNALDNAFIFDVPRETLENAPGFDEDQLPDTTSPDWDAEIRSFWGMSGGQDTVGD